MPCPRSAAKCAVCLPDVVFIMLGVNDAYILNRPQCAVGLLAPISCATRGPDLQKPCHCTKPR
jgi:lysophospholipase L1-like esterase